jgi:hypothetical protein
MFHKIPVANGGDECREAGLATQAHGGAAAVTPKPKRLGRDAAGDRAAGA